MKETLKKIRDTYCYGDFFLNRGLSVFNAFYQIMKYLAFAGILIGMINEVIERFGWYIPMDYVFVLLPFIITGLIFIGYIDATKIHALQKSNEIGVRFNPYLVGLIKGRGKKKRDYSRENL